MSSDEEEDDWFSSGFFNVLNDEAPIDENHGDESIDSFQSTSLLEIMERIQSHTRVGENRCMDYLERKRLVDMQMGSMALCRGQRGKQLHEAGAVDALMSTIYEIGPVIPSQLGVELDDTQTSAADLCISCLGALRDLACGIALNRNRMREFGTNDGVSGMKLITSYIERYRDILWKDLCPNVHLRLLSQAVGVLRNVTHSTPSNCKQLYQLGVSKLLTWRLLHAEGIESRNLPASSQPWRECAFRSAGTLINMAEKCQECANECASNPVLVQLLIESWGGSNKHLAVVHLGLVAILEAVRDHLPTGKPFPEEWKKILQNEEKRKKVAQLRELKRKEKLENHE